MISIGSTAAARSLCLMFAGNLLCAAAHASPEAPRQDIDANWSTPAAPAAVLPKKLDLDKLPSAPPVTPHKEKILPKSEWFSFEQAKAPDRRCEPGLDALFLPKECGNDPRWLGSPKK